MAKVATSIPMRKPGRAEASSEISTDRTARNGLILAGRFQASGICSGTLHSCTLGNVFRNVLRFNDLNAICCIKSPKRNAIYSVG